MSDRRSGPSCFPCASFPPACSPTISLTPTKWSPSSNRITKITSNKSNKNNAPPSSWQGIMFSTRRYFRRPRDASRCKHPAVADRWGGTSSLLPLVVPVEAAMLAGTGGVPQPLLWRGWGRLLHRSTCQHCCQHCTTHQNH